MAHPPDAPTPPEPPHPWIGRTLRDKWRIDGLLGKGGMATVFSATHRNGMRGAIKVLNASTGESADARARFIREGRAANRIDHPGVVKILDDDVTEDGLTFLVLEMLEGETWKDRWRAHDRRLPVRETIEIATEVLDVLAAAHRAGVIHRDVKPDNVFLCKGTGDLRGPVKLLDFGIARLREVAGEATADGATLGTPAFMSPEQALAHTEQIDHRSDLYAVGATLWTLLSGRLVHPAATAPALLIAAATTPAAPFSSVMPDAPADLAGVIDRALAFDKEARWADADAMREALRRTLDAPAVATLRAGVARFEDLSAPTERSGAAVAKTIKLDASPLQATDFGAQKTLAQATAAAPTPRRSSARALIGAGAVIAVGAGVAVLVSTIGGASTSTARPSASSAPTPSSAPPPSTPEPVASAAPPGAHQAKNLFAGLYSTCAVRKDGRVVCWGNDPKVGVTKSAPGPALVKRLEDPRSLAIGEAVDLAIVPAGAAGPRLIGWGKNVSELLGTSVPDGAVVDVEHAVDLEIPGATDVAVGMVYDETSACAVVDGKIECWGRAGLARKGAMSEDRAPLAIRLVAGPFELPARHVGLGASDFACALGQNDDFVSFGCWGTDHPELTRQRDPKSRSTDQFWGASPLDAWAVGPSGACFTSGRSVTCWGGVARCDESAEAPPMFVEEPSSSIAVAGDHQCLVSASGKLACWGRASSATGDPKEKRGTLECSPVPVPLPDKATKVVVGGAHTCALTASGDVYCFGRNDAGQRGCGDEIETPVPCRVSLDVHSSASRP
ncbi:MAG: protein kinase [Polyangiaceae bacterium]